MPFKVKLTIIPDLNCTTLTNSDNVVMSLQVRTALAEDARKEGILDMPETMFNYFIERVRSNLHIILCMSPVGDIFR